MGRLMLKLAFEMGKSLFNSKKNGISFFDAPPTIL